MTGPSVVATVDLDGEPDRFGRFDADRWAALALAALVHEGVEDGEVNLLFVGEAEMTRLNAEHMRRDGPTDVLSFPIDERPDGLPGEVLLGDIVVCPHQASRQAADHADGRRHRGTLEDELATLVVHGVLHLLGHDHADPDEARRMGERERVLLEAHHRR